MASDLSEVVFLEGEAQRLQKLGYLLGGLIGKIRGEGKVEGWSLVHRLGSMFFRFRGCVLSGPIRLLFGHT